MASNQYRGKFGKTNIIVGGFPNDFPMEGSEISQYCSQCGNVDCKCGEGYVQKGSSRQAQDPYGSAQKQNRKGAKTNYPQKSHRRTHGMCGLS